MAMMSAQQIAQNWQNGMGNATAKMKAGVNAVTVSPTQKAAAAADRYVQGIQRSVAEGKWQAGLNRVSLQQWKDDMLNKGIGRVASGAAAAVNKVTDFWTQFGPHLEAGVKALESMPRGDLETNIQRANAMMRHNATFRRRN